MKNTREKSISITRKASGTYFIRARKTGWYLWFKKYENGIPFRESVDLKLFRDLGFRREWSLDEAKRHCTQINKEGSLIREKMRLSAKRVTELKTINETLFPQERIDEFQALLDEENFGSSTHLKKLISHFTFIQKMCNELRIQPIEYKDNAKRIHKYFVKEKISPNYCSRIISLIFPRKSGHYFKRPEQDLLPLVA